MEYSINLDEVLAKMEEKRSKRTVPQNPEVDTDTSLRIDDLEKRIKKLEINSIKILDISKRMVILEQKIDTIEKEIRHLKIP
jgi:hypothetical protein